MDLLHLLVTKTTADDVNKTITCWASRSDVVDRDSEILLPEAWSHADSLADFLAHPVILVGHDYKGLVVGRALKVEPMPQGLRMQIRFLDTPSGEECWEICREGNGSLGSLGTFSIGFQGVDSEYRTVAELRQAGVDVSRAKGSRVRCWTHVRLFEVSLVAVPSCPTATVISKAFKDGRIKDHDLREELIRIIPSRSTEEYVAELKSGMDTLESQFESLRNKVISLTAENEKLKKRLDPKAKMTEAEAAAYLQTPGFTESVKKQTQIAIDKALGKVY